MTIQDTLQGRPVVRCKHCLTPYIGKDAEKQAENCEDRPFEPFKYQPGNLVQVIDNAEAMKKEAASLFSGKIVRLGQTLRFSIDKKHVNAYLAHLPEEEVKHPGEEREYALKEKYILKKILLS